jgi:hypothetical protein
MIIAFRRMLSDPGTWFAGIIAIAGGTVTTQIPDVPSATLTLIGSVLIPALIVMVNRIMTERSKATVEQAQILATAEIEKARILAKADVDKARILAQARLDRTAEQRVEKIADAKVKADALAPPALVSTEE